MALKGLARHGRGAKAPALPLTSLLDMFTIILVFLMVSFQAEDEDFVLHSGLELPSSSAESPFKKAVSLAITSEEVFVEGERLGARSEELPIAEAMLQAWEDKGGGDEERVVVVQADKELPYEAIYGVLQGAGEAGFLRYRLVVEKQ